MNTININELTIGQAKELAQLLSPATATVGTAPHPYVMGRKYFVRTVTYHLVGQLIGVYEGELVFADASWVADSGRWSEALKTGNLIEVEPFNTNAIVSRAAIVDATEWAHELPREAK